MRGSADLEEIPPGWHDNGLRTPMIVPAPNTLRPSFRALMAISDRRRHSGSRMLGRSTRFLSAVDTRRLERFPLPPKYNSLPGRKSYVNDVSLRLSNLATYNRQFAKSESADFLRQQVVDAHRFSRACLLLVFSISVHITETRHRCKRRCGRLIWFRQLRYDQRSAVPVHECPGKGRCGP